MVMHALYFQSRDLKNGKKVREGRLQLMHFTAARLITRMCVTRQLWRKKIVPTNWTSSRSLNGSKKKFCHERSIRREILFNFFSEQFQTPNHQDHHGNNFDSFLDIPRRKSPIDFVGASAMVHCAINPCNLRVVLRYSWSLK